MNASGSVSLAASIIIAVACIAAIAVGGASAAVNIALLIIMFMAILVAVRIIYVQKERRRIRKEYEEWIRETEETQEGVTSAEGNSRIYIIFDTETTGLPRNPFAPASNTRNWPRLVQLSWILEDDKRTRISEGDYIIRPDGFTIPQKVTRIHGISQERAEREGIPLSTAIEMFMKDFNMATLAVGHNIAFDKRVVAAELIRLGMEDTVSSKPSYCTMLHGREVCKITGMFGYKCPKLQELHKALFGCNFDNAHNSAADAAATEECFFKLRIKN